jgi:hypothetical protein
MIHQFTPFRTAQSFTEMMNNSQAMVEENNMGKNKQHKKLQRLLKQIRDEQKRDSFDRWLETQKAISSPISARPKLRKTIQDRKPFLVPTRIPKEGQRATNESEAGNIPWRRENNAGGNSAINPTGSARAAENAELKCVIFSSAQKKMPN